MAGGIAHPIVSAPPRLPDRAGLGVDAVIFRFHATCLEGAMIRQRWLAAHGIVRDVVIGLPNEDFGDTPAHAWVDGLDRAAQDNHLEIHRFATRPSDR